MKYFKLNSIPLEEIKDIGIGQQAVDMFGNYIEVDAFEKPHIIAKTVLNDDERVDEYAAENFLVFFWRATSKNIERASR